MFSAIAKKFLPELRARYWFFKASALPAALEEHRDGFGSL
jgi:hypothetical protein